MEFSPAKARRFVAVIEDIIGRFPSDPSQFREHGLLLMFEELNALGKLIGAPEQIVWFSFHTAERQTVDLYDIYTGKSKEHKDAYCNGQLNSSIWLTSRRRYGGLDSTLVWCILPVKDGPFAGLPSKSVFITRNKLDALNTTLREWQRWVQGLLDEHAEENAAKTPTEETKATSDTTPKGTQRTAKKNKRGRPVDTDAKADERTYDAWKTRSYRTFADLASEKEMTTLEVKQAIDRHRKRLKRRTKPRRKSG